MDTAERFREFVATNGGTRVYGNARSDVYRDIDGLETQIWDSAILKYVPGSDPRNLDVKTLRTI